MLRLTCLTAVILLAPSTAAAYPIQPVTLWSLVERADLVVLAQTQSIERLRVDRRDLYRWVARLEVLETWKGSAPEEVRVAFPTFICPAPPRYVEGELVLAFLRTSETKYQTLADYRTVGLSYGSLYPQLDEIEVWRAAVSLAMELHVHRKPTADEHRRWLVEVAARRPTRWHGIYDLDEIARARGKLSLTAIEMSVLARGIVNEPSLDSSLVTALRLLRDHQSRELDRVATAAVDELMRDAPTPADFDELVVLTLDRLARKDSALAAVAEEKSSPREIWASVRPLISIDTSAVTFPATRQTRR
jgi:hypothetical protein